MTHDRHVLLRRRGLASLMAAALPPALARFGAASSDQELFTQDVVRSYEDQLIGFDMEDVDAVLGGITSPRLGFGSAQGAGRATAAAAAAIRAAGGVGTHSLVIVSARATEGRLREYKHAMNTVRDEAPPDATVIYGARIDPTLAEGVLRVSLLTG